jgi:hypothetical protein
LLTKETDDGGQISSKIVGELTPKVCLARIAVERHGGLVCDERSEDVVLLFVTDPLRSGKRFICMLVVFIQSGLHVDVAPSGLDGFHRMAFDEIL